MLSKQKCMKWLSFAVVIVAVTLLSAGVRPAAADAVPVTRYVATTGADTSDCTDSAAPCLTINYAISQATAGDTIEVAIGAYNATSGTSVVTIDKNITLSGGWDAGFTTQTGKATIDGQAAFRGVTINDGMVVTIDHFVIQNGSDSSFGGGINNRGDLTLSNSIVTHNISGWMGGGIDVYGTLTVNNSTISNNTAGSGGSGGGGGAGIELYSGTATLNNSTVSGNKIIGWYSGSAIDAMGTLFLNNSTISGNTGSYALTTFVGHIILNNTTVTKNSGGISNDQGVVSLRNSILAENNISGTSANCSGTIGSAGYNLVGNNSGCTFSKTTGDKVGTASSPIDPKLGPLANNGGPTLTHALPLGSPAIDAGNPLSPGSGGNACLATDQRGRARPKDGDVDGVAHCDMGAYELQLPVVTSINRVGANPTSAVTVAFAVTFSGSVNGVDATDFRLASSGITGAAITGVSGSGSSYTVSVNTGTGLGTLRLDLIDNDTIVDATSGDPLGGPGAGNGSFRSGQAYTMQKPVVSAITRASANPTSAASVQFTVTFSQAVTGVNQVAPFSDFSLTTSGVTGASIKSVSGSGKTYTVTVGTGSGNGTIRLNVVDHDTIMDGRNTPLGGAGVGNGNFTSGQVYTISKIPVPQSPSGTIWDTTPTYKWGAVPQATQYRYQLYKDTTLIYTNTMLASACGASACSNTPTTQLIPGAYKWRVQAMLGGVWKSFSPYKIFTLYAPKAGYWSGTGLDFYVTTNRVQVNKFSIYISVKGCGNYKITKPVLLPISNTGTFAFSGAFYANGAFSQSSLNPASATGSVGLYNFYISGCGLVSGGPYSWSALWRNSNQASALNSDNLLPAVITPVLDMPFDFLPPGTFTLEP